MSEDAMNNAENGKGNEDDRKIFAGGLPQVGSLAIPPFAQIQYCVFHQFDLINKWKLWI